MSRRTVAIIILVLSLTGCSTFRPHVNQYKSGHVFCDTTDIDTDAHRLANYLRCKYTDVINDRVTWDRGSGMAIVGALGVAAYKGVTGGSGDTIAALTAGSAALYGINLTLANDKIAAVYSAGIEAVSCVESKYGANLAMQIGSGTTKEYREWVKGKLADFVRKKTGVDAECKAELENIENMSERLRDLELQYDVLDLQRAANDQRAISELNQVDGKVKSEVNKLLPNIESIYLTATATTAGLPTAASKTASVPPPARAKGINEKPDCPVAVTDEDRAAFDRANQWIETLKDLIKRSSGADTSQVACSLSIVKTLTVGDGRDRTYDIKKGATLQLPLLNTSGQLTVSVPDGAPIKATAEYDSKRGYVLSIQAGKEPNKYLVTVTDHAQNVVRIVLVQVVE